MGRVSVTPGASESKAWLIQGHGRRGPQTTLGCGHQLWDVGPNGHVASLLPALFSSSAVVMGREPWAPVDIAARDSGLPAERRALGGDEQDLLWELILALDSGRLPCGPRTPSHCD